MKSRMVTALLVLLVTAALPLAAQTINGCVDTNKGTLRITKPGEPCDPNKEYAISWNSQGVAGKDGKDGTNGTNGVNGLNGRDGRDGLDCTPAPVPAPVQVGTISFAAINGGAAAAIYQFSGGATNPGGTFGGGGGGAGKVDFNGIIVVRKIDAASATLLQHVSDGQEVQTVTITLNPGNAGARTVTLNNVSVTGYSFTRLPGSNDAFETLTLNFAKITVDFDGTRSCWDIVANKSC